MKIAFLLLLSLGFAAATDINLLPTVPGVECPYCITKQYGGDNCFCVSQEQTVRVGKKVTFAEIAFPKKYCCQIVPNIFARSTCPMCSSIGNLSPLPKCLCSPSTVRIFKKNFVANYEGYCCG
jgi:hypothetical protein